MPSTLQRLATAVCLFLMLGGCEGSSSDAAARRSGNGLADCAIGAGAGWTRSCAVERDGDILTLRHEDGGFRRFQIVRDGRGLLAADGSEEAKVAILSEGMIEVSIGQDRYRLPASIAEGLPR